MDDDQPSAPRPRAWVWATVAAGVPVVVAAVLCACGSYALIGNYDGFTSWVNPVAVGGCCIAFVVILIAPWLWWQVYESVRND